MPVGLPQLRLPEPPKGLTFDVPRVAESRLDVNAAGAGPAAISILGAIGDVATAASVSAALKQIGNRPVRVELNSTGGDYFEGAGIYNLLRQHRAGVTVQVLGVAASAASLIAMAGRKIEIARNSQVMIHRAWTIAVGNGELMAEAGAFLGRLDAAMADVYAARTGQNVAKVAAMMAAETWMGAADAVALGFADAMLAIDGPVAAKALDGPRNGRDVAADLRRLGYSKSLAESVATHGWRKGATPETTPLNDLAARIARATTDLRKGRST